MAKIAQKTVWLTETAGQIKIVGAMYDMQSGTVMFLEE